MTHYAKSRSERVVERREKSGRTSHACHHDRPAPTIDDAIMNVFRLNESASLRKTRLVRRKVF